MVFDEVTKSAAVSLGAVLGPLPYIPSVGIGREHGRPILIVYLRRSPKRGNSIPDTWEGLPVRVRNIGRLST